MTKAELTDLFNFHLDKTKKNTPMEGEENISTALFLIAIAIGDCAEAIRENSD